MSKKTHADPNEKKTVVEERDFEFTSAPPKDVECCICMLTLRNPVELRPCCHLFCRKCLEKCVQGGKNECPTCRENIKSTGEAPRILLNILSALEVRCLRCGWVGTQEQLQAHLMSSKGEKKCEKLPAIDLARKIGDDYVLVGKFDQAIEAFTKGIEREKLRLANITSSGGNAQKDQSPTLPILYVNRSIVYGKIEKWQSSRDDADEAIKLNPRHGRAYLQRAFCSRRMEKSQGADWRKDLEKALSLDKSLSELASELLNDLSPVMSPIASSVPLDSRKEVIPEHPQKSNENISVTAIAVRNVHSLLRALSDKFGEKFAKYYRELSAEGRCSFLKYSCPYIVERKGTTLDSEGEDLTETARLCPELNIQDLCRSNEGAGLTSLILDAKNHGFSATGKEHVVHVVDVLEGTDPSGKVRKQWLNERCVTKYGFVEKACGNVVATTTGEVIPASVFQLKNITAPHQLGKLKDLQSKRQQRIYVAEPFYWLGMERMLILESHLCEWIIDFAKKTKPGAIEKFPNFKNCYHCIQCGEKQPQMNCSDCKDVFVCSAKCQKELHQWHSNQCGSDANCFDNLNSSVRKIMERENEALDLARGGESDLVTIKKTTDWNKCLADPYGDGDQTPLSWGDPSKGFNDPRTIRNQSLRSVWSSGANFSVQPGGGLSDFMLACVHGDVSLVEETINLAKSSGETDMLFKLVNRRESLLRLPPVIGAICGARLKGLTNSCSGDDFKRIVSLLLENGANPSARDVAGFSTVHHCATQMASTESLQLLPLFIAAGADANVLNRLDEYPLMEPILCRRMDCCQALLQVGADPYRKTNQGNTSIGFSIMQFPEVSTFFQQWTPNIGVKVGDTVSLKGLINKPHLNGKQALITALEIPGKYKVKFQEEDGGGEVVVHMKNILKIVVERCWECHAQMKEPLRCSRCKLALYCTPQCQKKNWPGHKPTCKTPSSEQTPINIGKPDLSQEFLMDLTTGKKGYAKDLSKVVRGEFIVKVQIPMENPIANLLASKAPENSPMRIYDEKKKFDGLFPMSRQGVKELGEIVKTKGICAAKIYTTARFNPEGELLVDRTPVQAQPW